MSAASHSARLLATGSLFLALAAVSSAHELSTHSGHDSDHVAEAKLFIGRHGYQHAGFGFATRIDDSSTIGLRSHVVR